MTGLSHKDDLLETPPWLMEKIEKETNLNFMIDLCASEENTKCDCFIDKEMDLLKQGDVTFKYHPKNEALFCNPPRSLNGKFVNFVYDELWLKYRLDIVMLLCWNDLGNKYGERLLPRIMNREIKVKNLGKIKFYKNGKETEFPSRLTYLYAWFKKKH